MAAWTTFVLRFRTPVLVLWALVALSGFVAYLHLAPLLSNQFTVPGTDSERVRTVLQERFGVTRLQLGNHRAELPDLALLTEDSDAREIA